MSCAHGLNADVSGAQASLFNASSTIFSCSCSCCSFSCSCSCSTRGSRLVDIRTQCRNVQASSGKYYLELYTDYCTVT